MRSIKQFNSKFLLSATPGAGEEDDIVDLGVGAGGRGVVGAASTSVDDEDEIYVDLSQAVKFEPVDDGAYEIVCEERPTVFTADKSQLPCLKWTYTITDTAGQEKFAGQKLFRNTPLAGKGSGFTEEVLTALGVEYRVEKDATGENTIAIRFKGSATIGARGIAHVKQRMWKDPKTGEQKPQNDVKSLSSLITPETAQAAAQSA